VVSKAAMPRCVWLAAVLCCGAAACAPKKVAVDPSIAARATVEQADKNLRAGCFDCLAEALRQYESARNVPALSDAATRGAVRASILLALRERELGTTDSGYVERAKQLASSSPAIQADMASALDIAEIMPWRAGAGRSGQPDSPLTIFTNRQQRTETLRALAGRDELSAYVWIDYACASGVGLSLGDGEMRAPVAAFTSLPLIEFALITCRTSGGTGRPQQGIDDVLAEEPRYKEIAFFKGLVAIGARKLDDAEARYREAYAWRQTWPAATLSLANVLVTGEDFAGALEFYERTLALAPLYPDALLGKLRTLTYLSKSDEAIAVADELLRIGRYPGDANYWKAYNELDLKRYDDAWRDVEAAEKMLVNSDVPKLAGIIAIDRMQLEVARERLELARQRNGFDCQALYYLHLVYSELRQWSQAASGAVVAAGCISSAEVGLKAEIENVRGSDIPEARKERIIAARERQIASGIRMRANCWYNGAVANYNLSKRDEAKDLAQRITDDEQLGQRARELLARLENKPGK
jgi:tetratricopeptide (TPR) repeat protein